MIAGFGVAFLVPLACWVSLRDHPGGSRGSGAFAALALEGSF
ncbi:hypothetical protein SynA1560_00261 [Synechococcus sp. A15-60]|nr:hypothetical protein SynA1560_00261 [Synechococcus sp. A15-60]